MKLREKTTATLLIAIFLASMLSVMVLGQNPTVDHIEWLPPLTKHDEFGFKDGSTLPIKFRLEDNLHKFVLDPDVVVTVNDEFGYLFRDNFEDLDFTANAWTTISGIWAVEEDGNNIYSVDRTASPNVEAITVAGETSWTDYVLEYKCYITENGVEREGSAFVRADSTALNGYLIHPQVPDGKVALWKRSGGSYTMLFLSNYAGITSDTWHTIKVMALGPNIKVYVDGLESPIIDYTDNSPFLSGRIGLRLADNRHAHFDDVKVGKIWTSFSIGDGLETPLKYKLFSDSFEDANAWTPIEGTWAVEDDGGDNAYSQDNQDTDLGPQMSLAGDSDWTDYSVEVNAKGIEGYYPGYGTHTWVGLAFRAQDSTHFYEYYFRTTVPDIIVIKNDGGARTTISGPVPFTCANENWYNLKVIAEGNSFRFFVDDVEISGLAFTDDSFPNGNAGVLVFYGSHAHFDDFSVSSYQYQCSLRTKELEMPAGEYMITVSDDGYEYQYPFVLFEGGKAKGKPD